MSIYNTPSSCVRVGTNLFLGFKCIEVPFKFVYWIKAFCLCQEPQFKQNKIKNNFTKLQNALAKVMTFVLLGSVLTQLKYKIIK